LSHASILSCNGDILSHKNRFVNSFFKKIYFIDLFKNSFSFSKLSTLIQCSILQLSSYAVSSLTPNAISALAITKCLS